MVSSVRSCRVGSSRCVPATVERCSHLGQYIPLRLSLSVAPVVETSHSLHSPPADPPAAEMRSVLTTADWVGVGVVGGCPGAGRPAHFAPCSIVSAQCCQPIPLTTKIGNYRNEQKIFYMHDQVHETKPV
ncbi:hypothetical protein J6590_087031 [Homalodisca vitripennis]|nr:hypothetical protein J6590_087031 [Homalodisca vitripennis]